MHESVSDGKKELYLKQGDDIVSDADGNPISAKAWLSGKFSKFMRKEGGESKANKVVAPPLDKGGNTEMKSYGFDMNKIGSKKELQVQLAKMRISSSSDEYWEAMTDFDNKI